MSYIGYDQQILYCLIKVVNRIDDSIDYVLSEKQAMVSVISAIYISNIRQSLV